MSPLAALFGCVLFAAPGPGPDAAAPEAPPRAETDWYLLEFASGRPLCETTTPTSRCWQTQPEIARFNIRDGEVLEMPGAALPESWARFERLWVYAPSVPAKLRLSLTRTPRGLRIEFAEDGESYLQTLPEDEWVPVDGGANRRFWARASRL